MGIAKSTIIRAAILVLFICTTFIIELALWPNGQLLSANLTDSLSSRDFSNTMLLVSLELCIFWKRKYPKRVAIWLLCAVVAIAYIEIVVGHFLRAASLAVSLGVPVSEDRQQYLALGGSISSFCAFAVMFIPPMLMTRKFWIFEE